MQVPTAQPITAGGVTQPLGDSWSAGDPRWGLTQVVFAWVLVTQGSLQDRETSLAPQRFSCAESPRRAGKGDICLPAPPCEWPGALLGEQRVLGVDLGSRTAGPAPPPEEHRRTPVFCAEGPGPRPGTARGRPPGDTCGVVARCGFRARRQGTLWCAPPGSPCPRLARTPLGAHCRRTAFSVLLLTPVTLSPPAIRIPQNRGLRGCQQHGAPARLGLPHLLAAPAAEGKGPRSHVLWATLLQALASRPPREPRPQGGSGDPLPPLVLGAGRAELAWSWAGQPFPRAPALPGAVGAQRLPAVARLWRPGEGHVTARVLGDGFPPLSLGPAGLGGSRRQQRPRLRREHRRLSPAASGVSSWRFSRSGSEAPRGSCATRLRLLPPAPAPSPPGPAERALLQPRGFLLRPFPLSP